MKNCSINIATSPESQQNKSSQEKQAITSSNIWQQVRKLKQDLDDTEYRLSRLEEFIRNRQRTAKNEDTASTILNEHHSDCLDNSKNIASSSAKDSSLSLEEFATDKGDVIDDILGLRDWSVLLSYQFQSICCKASSQIMPTTEAVNYKLNAILLSSLQKLCMQGNLQFCMYLHENVSPLFLRKS